MFPEKYGVECHSTGYVNSLNTISFARTFFPCSGRSYASVRSDRKVMLLLLLLVVSVNLSSGEGMNNERRFGAVVQHNDSTCLRMRGFLRPHKRDRNIDLIDSVTSITSMIERHALDPESCLLRTNVTG